MKTVTIPAGWEISRPYRTEGSIHPEIRIYSQEEIVAAVFVHDDRLDAAFARSAAFVRAVAIVDVLTSGRFDRPFGIAGLAESHLEATNARSRMALDETPDDAPPAAPHDTSADPNINAGPDGRFFVKAGDRARRDVSVSAAPPVEYAAPADRRFAIGDRVTKIKGSKWTGRVVGLYSTALTPIGYAVESETEAGSVQIYPEAALDFATHAEPSEPAPTKDAYSAACRALEKHRERADFAEARIRELEAALKPFALHALRIDPEKPNDEILPSGLFVGVYRAAFRALGSRTQADAPAATVLDEIAAERRRQIEVEGWTPEHDDQHRAGDLACAAGCYALHAGQSAAGRVAEGYAPVDWLWQAEWWKPKDRRRDLIRAAALILAEIELLDRAAPAQPAEEAGD